MSDSTGKSMFDTFRENGTKGGFDEKHAIEMYYGDTDRNFCTAAEQFRVWRLNRQRVMHPPGASPQQQAANGQQILKLLIASIPKDKPF